MRVVVTGQTGQIGGALAARLQARASVVATDRTLLDLSSPAAIPSVLEQLAPDIILNAAAYTEVDKAEDESALARQVNATAPGIMARWAASRAVPFIHFSTDYVFDGAGSRPRREDDPTGPLSVYGAGKLAGEAEVRAAAGSFLIIRTSWIYSADGRNFLRKIAELAQTNEELRVVADQTGAPTSAALVANVVAAILEGGLDDVRAKAAAAGGIVHVTASGEASWYDFATEALSGLKSRGVKFAAERVAPIRSDQWPSRARRPGNSRLDLGRLKTVFGISPPHWREALSPELDALAVEMASSANSVSV